MASGAGLSCAENHTRSRRSNQNTAGTGTAHGRRMSISVSGTVFGSGAMSAGGVPNTVARSPAESARPVAGPTVVNAGSGFAGGSAPALMAVNDSATPQNPVWRRTAAPCCFLPERLAYTLLNLVQRDSLGPYWARLRSRRSFHRHADPSDPHSLHELRHAVAAAVADGGRTSDMRELRRHAAACRTGTCSICWHCRCRRPCCTS